MLDETRMDWARERMTALTGEMAKVLVGLSGLCDRLVVGLLCRGHILIEGVPGLAKTLAVRTLAGAIRADFRRVQFTPDLLPSDIVGTEIYEPHTGRFSVRPGPVFAHILLADEINRAPSKVQSALLEAMAERRVTIGGDSLPLPEPFMVLATQNPIEQEGTYPLPEAQVDRFLLALRVDYPDPEAEREIVRRACASEAATLRPVLTGHDILTLAGMTGEVHLDARLLEYIVEVVGATRKPEAVGLGDLAGRVAYGASPRASIALAKTARALALMAGRPYVTPGDIKSLAPDVLRHRVLLTYEALAEGLTPEAVVRTILDTLAVP